MKIFIIIIVFYILALLGCKDRSIQSAPLGNLDSVQIEDAIWMVYCLNFLNTAEPRNFGSILRNPTECSVRIKEIKRLGLDTSEVYFTFYYPYPADSFILVPHDQFFSGIGFVKGKLRYPICKTAFFDFLQSETKTMDFMHKMEAQFIGYPDGILKWYPKERVLADWLRRNFKERSLMFRQKYSYDIKGKRFTESPNYKYHDGNNN